MMEKNEVVHIIYKTLAKNNEIKVKTYKKDEIITNFLTNRNYIYFVLSGSCSLYRYARNGDMIFLQRYDRYDSFGDCFHNIELNSELSVVANNKVSVFFFDYDEIIKIAHAINTPMVVAIPFPPLNLRNTGNICPTTTASPAT